MKTIQLMENDGVYTTSEEIPITTEQWEMLLQEPSVFNERALEIVKLWYQQPFHQATCKEASIKEGCSPHNYNGSVVGLGKRILKFLGNPVLYGN